MSDDQVGRRVVQRHTLREGRSEITFPTYATVLSVGEVRSDTAYVGPVVRLFVETFTGSTGRPDKHLFAVLRSGEPVPDGFQYVGTVPDNWEDVHVYEMRVPM